jgi:hypothetical protein
MIGKKRRKLRPPKSDRTIGYASRSSSGLVVGFPGIPGAEGLHITLTKEPGNVGRHLTDEAGGPGARLSLGRLRPDEIAWLLSFIRPRLVAYDPDKVVAVPSGDYSQGPVPEVKSDGTGLWSQETLEVLRTADFSNGTSWRQASLRTLLAEGQAGGFVREGIDVYFLQPAADPLALKLSLADLGGDMAPLLKIGGFPELLRMARERVAARKQK